MASESRVLEQRGYVSVDLTACDPHEAGAAYREFAVACIDKAVCRAILIAGGDDRAAHYGLRDAFTAIVLSIGIPRNFRLALVATSRSVEEVYQLVVRDFQILGIQARIFADREAARHWVRI